MCTVQRTAQSRAQHRHRRHAVCVSLCLSVSLSLICHHSCTQLAQKTTTMLRSATATYPTSCSLHGDALHLQLSKSCRREAVERHLVTSQNPATPPRRDPIDEYTCLWGKDMEEERESLPHLATPPFAWILCSILTRPSPVSQSTARRAAHHSSVRPFHSNGETQFFLPCQFTTFDCPMHRASRVPV